MRNQPTDLLTVHMDAQRLLATANEVPDYTLTTVAPKLMDCARNTKCNLSGCTVTAKGSSRCHTLGIMSLPRNCCLE